MLYASLGSPVFINHAVNYFAENLPNAQTIIMPLLWTAIVIGAMQSSLINSIWKACISWVSVICQELFWNLGGIDLVAFSLVWVKFPGVAFSLRCCSSQMHPASIVCIASSLWKFIWFIEGLSQISHQSPCSVTLPRSSSVTHLPSRQHGTSFALSFFPLPLLFWSFSTCFLILGLGAYGWIN